MIKATVIEGGLRLYEGTGAGLHFIFTPLSDSVLGVCERLQIYAADEQRYQDALDLVMGDGTPELGVDYPQVNTVISTWVEELELEVDAAPMDVISIKLGKHDVVVVTVGVNDPSLTDEDDWV